jgi:peptidoglycan/xylan/chitin deacetylase (PgdA/CDA1 family)/CelD/BcsL family acetyltransferase involved in cellulose biosynthesis
MKVVEIRREDELESLRTGWDALLRESAGASTFVTWEWAAAWWSAYGTPGDLRLLAAFKGDALCGIAPLRRKTVRRCGQTVEALCFVGDGSNDSDYLDFIATAGREASVMDAFCGVLDKELDRGAVLLLNEIPAASPHLRALQDRFAGAQGRAWSEADVDCGALRLPETWEEYLSRLRPRFRTKVRSVLRDMESRPDVRFGFCETPQQVGAMLPVLFDLHTRRWNHDGKPGVFGWDAKRAFYRNVSTRLLERGWLRFSWLEWNGRVLACQYGFTYGNTYYHLQEGYEPDSAHWNIGIALRAWSIRKLLHQGIREYDFLGGLGRHKTDWGADLKRSKQVLVAKPGFGNLLFRRGPAGAARARESVKRVLPEAVLAARRARPESRNGGAHHSAGRDRLRLIAAGCYYNLGIPALVRPLRERYQVSIRPGLSCKPRSEPSARILYYHRVNDDADPFFPAIGTDLFESEMCFLARHYRVVGLDRLLDCLESGEPETVVAITFDDGYQDNYRNAFPILQRYGLPATIFLTTGCLDTGEMLWFERLSGALKTTEREFIDLEIHLPIRCWLRTTAERLAANDRIGGILRELPDSSRRNCLDDILRQLAPRVTGARNAMLTWDQVRLMKARGIDFGGHTVTHPFLSRTDPQQAAWEIFECKRRIEQELQAPVPHFAYPNGREPDFNACNKELIRQAGYRAAATTIWGLNYPSTDRMELRRGQPWEENAAMFAYKLDWYQTLNG